MCELITFEYIFYGMDSVTGDRAWEDSHKVRICSIHELYWSVNTNSCTFLAMLQGYQGVNRRVTMLFRLQVNHFWLSNSNVLFSDAVESLFPRNAFRREVGLIRVKMSLLQFLVCLQQLSEEGQTLMPLVRLLLDICVAHGCNRRR